MDKQQIIDSNLLEKYILGDITELERTKLKQAMDQFPELKLELEQLELALEKVALDNKIEAPAGLKEKIVQEIQKENKPELSVVDKTRPTRLYKTNWFAMAASFVGGMFIVGAVAWSIISDTNETNLALADRISELDTQVAQMQEINAFVGNPGTLPVALRGVNNQAYSAISYWNEDLEKGIIRVVNLPPLPEEQTYQIWADVEGEMLDLGLLDYAASTANFIELKFLQDAESINITIEPTGGSDHPTVENLVVSGVI